MAEFSSQHLAYSWSKAIHNKLFIYCFSSFSFQILLLELQLCRKGKLGGDSGTTSKFASLGKQPLRAGWKSTVQNSVWWSLEISGRRGLCVLRCSTPTSAPVPLFSQGKDGYTFLQAALRDHERLFSTVFLHLPFLLCPHLSARVMGSPAVYVYVAR
jgi:hypothetical protein